MRPIALSCAALAMSSAALAAPAEKPKPVATPIAAAAQPGNPAQPAAPRAPAKPGLDLAYGAYQRGMYVSAFREAASRIEIDPSDAAAMTLLGELYNQGLGVRRDPDQAARWYRLAAERGDVHAMSSLGLMAADGRGTDRGPAAARAWFEKAAALGEPTASYNLALLLLASGAPADIPRAAGLLRVAADAELPDALHDLGVLYARGQGVKRDREEAARLYLRALKGGSLSGEVEYAIALANGDGVGKDEVMAARVFRRAASRGNAIAQNRLARLYATGRGVARNLVEAADGQLVDSGQGLPDTWLDGAIKDLPKTDRARAEQLATERAGTL